MSVTERDFDRLALLDSEGWTHNNHYHNFILRHVPNNCQNALEIGCGTGSLARRLAERAQNVVAIDLSSEMIRVARSHSAEYQNLQFIQADAMSWDFPAAHFDCIVTVATLHHLQLNEVVTKVKESTSGNGVLIIVDLRARKRAVHIGWVEG